jgi:hypothetical protein
MILYWRKALAPFRFAEFELFHFRNVCPGNFKVKPVRVCKFHLKLTTFVDDVSKCIIIFRDFFSWEAGWH